MFANASCVRIAVSGYRFSRGTAGQSVVFALDLRLRLQSDDKRSECTIYAKLTGTSIVGAREMWRALGKAHRPGRPNQHALKSLRSGQQTLPSIAGFEETLPLRGSRILSASKWSNYAKRARADCGSLLFETNPGN